MSYYNDNPCETHEVVYNRSHGYTEMRHKPSCKRCASKARVDSSTIDIYKWPLSAKEPTAKATVFELRAPQPFGDWRDASMFLITDVLGYHQERPDKLPAQYMLDQHHDLSCLFPPQYHE